MKSTAKAPIAEPRLSTRDGGVSIEAVSRTYAGRRGPVPALAGVTLRVAPREIVAVVGPSGCGKSTLLELVCGLQSPDDGRIHSEPAVYMPQRDLLLPWCSALDNAALPLRLQGLDRARARNQALPRFAQFGLAGFETAMPDELSGGMRQRVAFLRTLLAGKPVLALDEPFASLDALTRQEMQSWLAGTLVREPRTVLLVTHDVEEAVVLADRVAVLSARPGHLVVELPVDLPRPRSRTDAAVTRLRERAMNALGAA